jgi:pimeloyl-ACP methyl ester carboxylesterase
MTAVPFRIRITLIALATITVLVLVAPLLVPVPALEGTVSATALAYPDSRFVGVALPRGGGLQVHVQTMPPGLEPGTTDAAGAAAAAAGADVGVVLLHGFGSHTMTWRHLLPALAGVGPAIAFDRPGFGLTERPMPGDWPRGANPYDTASQIDLTIALMDAYGLERAVLVGHSAGGALAVEVALAHPERVAGLVLVSPAIVRGGGAPGWTRPLLHTPQMNRVGPLLMRQLGGSAGEGFLRAAYANPERLATEDVEAYRRALRAHHWDRALWELTKASREPRSLDALPRLGMPVLVLSGAADTIVPIADSQTVAERIPGATLVRIEDCGHVAHEECPDGVLAALGPWLAALPRDAGP